MELDPWAYRSQVQQAEALLKGLMARILLARKQLKRVQTLRRGGQSSRELLERRQAELDALLAQRQEGEAQRARAQQQAKRCTIRAPFAGVVTQRPAQLGAYANPGAPLVKLLNPTRVELSARLNSGLTALLPEDGRATFLHHDKRYPVTLRTLLPGEDPQTRSREARLRFDAEPPAPGAAGRLEWKDPKPHLPPWLLTRREGRLGIFLVKEKRAHFQPLPEALEGRMARVPGDLQGEMIIAGREALQHGDKVRVLKTKTTAKEQGDASKQAPAAPKSAVTISAAANFHNGGSLPPPSHHERSQGDFHGK